jgi:chaperonin GroEL (HSP60 family)
MQAVTSGANPVSIKRGIDKTCAHLVARLGELSRDVKGTEDIRVRPPSASKP